MVAERRHTIDRRRSPRRLVLLTLKCHGPLTDRQLVWWLGHFGVSPSSVRKTRRLLTQRGFVRFARRAVEAGNGQLARLWEITPGVN